jgi:hypothetical protein
MKHLSLKFALFGALFFLPVVISGCGDCPAGIFGGCGCDCDKEPETFYDIQAIYGNILSHEGTLKPNTAYKFDSLQISIGSQVAYVATLKMPPMKGGAGLWATPPCDCWEKYGAKGTKEKVKNLSIISSRDYTNALPKGTNLATVMSIFGDYETKQGGYRYYQTSIPKQKITDFVNTNPASPQGFNLFFDSPPTQDKKHIFTIRYELDNGEVYTYTTPEITFQ